MSESGKPRRVVRKAQKGMIRRKTKEAGDGFEAFLRDQEAELEKLREETKDVQSRLDVMVKANADLWMASIPSRERKGSEVTMETMTRLAQMLEDGLREQAEVARRRSEAEDVAPKRKMKVVKRVVKRGGVSKAKARERGQEKEDVIRVRKSESPGDQEAGTPRRAEKRVVRKKVVVKKKKGKGKVVRVQGKKKKMQVKTDGDKEAAEDVENGMDCDVSAKAMETDKPEEKDKIMDECCGDNSGAAAIPVVKEKPVVRVVKSKSVKHKSLVVKNESGMDGDNKEKRVKVQMSAVKDKAVKTGTRVVKSKSVKSRAPVMRQASAEAEAPVSKEIPAKSETPVVQEESVKPQISSVKGKPAKTRVAKAKSVKSEIPVIANVSVESEAPVAKDPSVKSEATGIQEEGVKTQVSSVKGKPVKTGTRVVKAKSVKSEPPVIKTVFAESETPVAKESSVKLEIPDVREETVQFQMSSVKGKPVKTGTRVIKAKSVKSQPPVIKTVFAECETPVVKELAVDSDTPGVKDLFAESDACVIKEKSRRGQRHDTNNLVRKGIKSAHIQRKSVVLRTPKPVFHEQLTPPAKVSDQEISADPVKSHVTDERDKPEKTDDLSHLEPPLKQEESNSSPSQGHDKPINGEENEHASPDHDAGPNRPVQSEASEVSETDLLLDMMRKYDQEIESVEESEQDSYSEASHRLRRLPSSDSLL